MRLTERQAIAIGSPCVRAEDTLANEFYRAERVGSLTFSTILSVNK